MPMMVLRNFVARVNSVLAREFFYSFMMIIYGSTLHLFWAVLSLWDRAAYKSTALSALVALAGPEATPWVCIVVALAALSAFIPINPITRICLMLPQQGVFVVSAVGAMVAIYNRSYADGTLRSQAFILADQLPIILAAICYSVSIVFLAMAHRVRNQSDIDLAKAVETVLNGMDKKDGV